VRSPRLDDGCAVSGTVRFPRIGWGGTVAIRFDARKAGATSFPAPTVDAPVEVLASLAPDVARTIAE